MESLFNRGEDFSVGQGIDNEVKSGGSYRFLQTLSDPGQKAYRARLLHIVPSELPQSNLCRVHFYEKGWGSRVIIMGLEKTEPKKVQNQRELESSCFGITEHKLDEAFPFFVLSAEYEKTRYLLMKFSKIEEISKFTYSVTLTHRNHLSDYIRKLDLDAPEAIGFFGKFLKVSEGKLEVDREKVETEYFQKFLYGEEINGLKILKMKYPGDLGYRMYWQAGTLVFSVYDSEGQDEFRRGLILLEWFQKNRRIHS